ncbi:Glucose-repressible alcohol dehydrogenase transcriptional effector [Gaertneriomyces sp. JEL0708]|nr:Glucose-repressible alcohol dehydrogenase transcriptional effector [Gaertneriomyces sp. JEL0708]
MSHASTSSAPAIHAIATSVPGPIQGPHHQKQVDAALSSRQASSQHYYARLFAASARSSNPETGATVNGVSIPPAQKPSEWTMVDFGGMSLLRINKSVFKFKFLTALFLNHNALSVIPPEIKQLTCLSLLDLSGNRLSTLPSEIGMMVTLKELRLFDNELTFLPTELGTLYQLELLGLEGNPLNEPIATMIQKEGTTAVVHYLRDLAPMGIGPQERDWIQVDAGEDYNPDGKDSFTVMSYNVLSEKYAPPQSYAYTPSWALNWEYRKDLILVEIGRYNADVVFLQEMQADQYDETFREHLASLDYEGVFYPKSRARTMSDYDRKQVDGCATFWKASKFSLLEKHCIEFQQIALQRPDLRKADDVFNRVMIKDNIATVAYLQHKHTGVKILTANAHLHWDPSYRDVKLVQTAMMMEELERLGTPWARTHNNNMDATKIPLLVAGDFNSLPDSGVYEFISSGRVAQDHPDFQNYTYGPYTSEGLHHRFPLQSAYSHVGELPFTNWTPTFKGTIDYVFYSQNAFRVNGLLGALDMEYMEKVVGMPTPHFPSDHVPIVVSLKVEGRKRG